ncbi:hypothetical protein K438DRAFT_1842812 [Mycena galopus ATCC 62051]|nr:hypothetical protein K438DRAFT_1842812 [Mycena galopus ATCC 62051]
MTSVGTDLPRARSRSPVKNTSTPGSPELQRKMSLSDMQRNMSESASDAGMGIPRPPSAADLRPNTELCPIATTATGVLLRANSFSSPSNRRKQHYVRRAAYRWHRYSRSFSSSDDVYLPSASASNSNGEYTGGGSGNAPRTLPIPPGVSANSIAARNAAAAGSYSAYAASGTSRNAGTPRSSLRTSTPRALPRRVHGPPRAMSAGAHLCAWARWERRSLGGWALPPPSAPPRAPSLKKSSHPCPSPRLLPFPTTSLVATATTRPPAASAPPRCTAPTYRLCTRHL